MTQKYLDENSERYKDLVAQGLGIHARAGIYGIFIENKLVYIGKSRNMLRRWAQHMEEIEYKGATPPKYDLLRQAKLLGFQISFKVMELVNDLKTDALDKLEGEYIRKLLPPLNQLVPREDNWHKTDKNPKNTYSLTKILRIEEKPVSYGETFKNGRNMPYYTIKGTKKEED